MNKNLDHGFSFILSFQSPQLSNEVSFFDRVINESRFWSGTGESVRDPEFLELSKRFQTSMSLLKKSDCFKFLKQFVLHSQEGDSVSTSKNKLSLMKKKCVFLKLFKNSNFFQKNIIYMLSSLSYICEDKRLALSRHLFGGRSISQFESKLLKKRVDPLLNFIQKTSFEVIFGIRQQLNRSFLESVFFEPDSESFPNEEKPSPYADRNPNEEDFGANLSRADQTVNSLGFLSLVEKLQKSSSFEKNVKADPLYGLFESGDIPLDFMKHWFSLKAKTEFLKNELSMSHHLICLETKRKLAMSQEAQQYRKHQQDLVLRKRDDECLPLVSQGIKKLKKKES